MASRQDEPSGTRIRGGGGDGPDPAPQPGGRNGKETTPTPGSSKRFAVSDEEGLMRKAPLVPHLPGGPRASTGLGWSCLCKHNISTLLIDLRTIVKVTITRGIFPCAH